MSRHGDGTAARSARPSTARLVAVGVLLLAAAAVLVWRLTSSDASPKADAALDERAAKLKQELKQREDERPAQAPAPEPPHEEAGRNARQPK